MVLHVSVIKKWNFKHYTTNEYSSMEKQAEGRNMIPQSLASVNDCAQFHLPGSARLVTKTRKVYSHNRFQTLHFK
jgi:hypothetical protein